VLRDDAGAGLLVEASGIDVAFKDVVLVVVVVMLVVRPV